MLIFIIFLLFSHFASLQHFLNICETFELKSLPSWDIWPPTCLLTKRKKQSLSQETIFLLRVSTPLFFLSVVLLHYRHSDNSVMKEKCVSKGVDTYQMIFFFRRKSQKRVKNVWKKCNWRGLRGGGVPTPNGISLNFFQSFFQGHLSYVTYVNRIFFYIFITTMFIYQKWLGPCS